MFLDSDSPSNRRRLLPAREVDPLTERVAMPPERLVGILLGLAVLGATSAVIALLVVVVTWWR